MPLNLSRLNLNQKEAVLHSHGPLLVLAGAGSGKTSTMAYRIAHLIAARNVPGTDVLGLSFTNKAATELKGRVRGLVVQSAGPRAAKGLTITTFHSLCARLLRADADRLGFQKTFTILDQNDQIDLLRQILRHIKLDERKFDPGAILFEIGQAKNRFMSPSQAEVFFLESGRLGSDYAIAAVSCYSRYQDQLRVLNAMDFDDLLFYAVKLLEEHQEVRDRYNYRFRHILVDEYQDTNPAQFRLLRLLTEKQQNICVVGDDDQSIYGWRGADATHILEFSHHFSSARTITLDQNYRSTTTILEAANHVIAQNKHRHPKKLWSDRGAGEPIVEVVLEEDRGEGEFVAEEILKRAREQNRPWKDFAVLYRSNPQSRIFEEALRRNQVPYQIVGGMSFLDRKEVKDVLSCFRLIANPKDDTALRRVINWPARGIGKSSIELLSTHALQNQISFFEGLPEAPRLLTRGAGAALEFHQMISSLRSRLEGTPPVAIEIAAWARKALEQIQAKKAVEAESDDPVQTTKKWENIEELVHSLGQLTFEDPGIVNGVDFLREFLNRMTLEAREEEENKEDLDLEKNQVTLLTLHGAKGLEYPVVFLVGMEEGFLPHRKTIEEARDFSEERRLCYVGITRARDHLVLTRTKNRIRYGKPVPRYRSRFLEEIPKSMILARDESYSPDLSSKEARDSHETKVKSFLDQIRENLKQSP